MAKAAVGLSQAEMGRRIAEIMGRDAPIHQTVVGSWLRADATPSLEQVLALDEVFGLDPGTLLIRAGMIARPSVLTAIANDSLLDASAREVLRWVYISSVDAVSRQRATTGGVKDDVLDNNLIKHYLTWIMKRTRAWRTGSEQHPGPVDASELADRYDPFRPAPELLHPAQQPKGAHPSPDAAIDEVLEMVESAVEAGAIDPNEGEAIQRALAPNASRRSLTERLGSIEDKLDRMPDPDMMEQRIHEKLEELFRSQIESEMRRHGQQDPLPDVHPDDEDVIPLLADSSKQWAPDGFRDGERFVTRLEWAIRLAANWRDMGNPITVGDIQWMRREFTASAARQDDERGLQRQIDTWLRKAKDSKSAT